MMSLEQLEPYWNKVVQANELNQKEKLFKTMLEAQHPELKFYDSNHTIQNCQTLLHYIEQFKHTLKTYKQLLHAETIEICANFMRIWIFEIIVRSLDVQE